MNMNKGSLRWTQVTLNLTSHTKINEPGFRVIDLNHMEGGYPTTIFFKEWGDQIHPRCFLRSYGQNKCVSLAILAGPGEESVTHSKDIYGQINTAGYLFDVENCRVPQNSDFCVIAKPGYYTNIESAETNPFRPFLHKKEEFEAFDDNSRNFVRLFENNAKTTYLVSYPRTCKKQEKIDCY